MPTLNGRSFMCYCNKLITNHRVDDNDRQSNFVKIHATAETSQTSNNGNYGKDGTLFDEANGGTSGYILITHELN